MVVTCADYAQARPSALWLRVRGCAVDYLGAGYRESAGTIQELFLPVRPVGASPTEPAALVAATRDPAVLAIAQSGIGSGRQPNQEQFLLMMLKIVTALGASREITGVARTGMVERARTRRVLSGLTTPLAPGAVVVDVNAQPGVMFPAVQIAVGVGLIVTALLRRRTPRGEVAGTFSGKVAGTFLDCPEPVAGSAPLPDDLRAATFSRNTAALTGAAGTFAEKVAGTFLEVRLELVRLRGLLLLNLPPEGGIEHIEYAAPLGGREETMRRISSAIKGIRFDARGRGHLRGADYAVIVDIGLGDPVSSAIAGADGVAGADAIRHLLVATGWRAYMPITGRFTEPADLQALVAQAGVSR